VEISVAFKESGLADGRLPILSCWHIIAVEDGDKVVFFVTALLSRGTFFLEEGNGLSTWIPHQSLPIAK
jgi:hypothetical protein